MPERPNAPDRTTLEQAGPTAKYTKLLPPDEFDKLTLDEKAEYLTAMAELLKPR
jgi:hypothetical protein